MSEPRLIFLGSVTVEPGATAFFDIPPDASPEATTAALVATEEARVAAEIVETKRLRQLFLEGGDETPDENKKGEPHE
jgi:hypothetical protein